MKIKALFAIVIAATALYSFPHFLNAGSSPDSLSSYSNPSSTGNPSSLDSSSRPSTKVPFDGGISLLIAAGVGIGIKKGYDKRKKSSSIEK